MCMKVTGTAYLKFFREKLKTCLGGGWNDPPLIIRFVKKEFFERLTSLTLRAAVTVLGMKHHAVCRSVYIINTCHHGEAIFCLLV